MKIHLKILRCSLEKKERQPPSEITKGHSLPLIYTYTLYTIDRSKSYDSLQKQKPDLSHSSIAGLLLGREGWKKYHT